MIACAAALVLLVDVSGSVSTEHHRMQRAGIADALRAPALARLAEGGPPLAITLIEWDASQATVLPWRLLPDQAALAAAAGAIEAAPRGGSHGATHLGEAIAAGIAAVAHAPCVPEQVVLDVSGDGASNGGREASEARDAAAAMGIQINGLPIVTQAEPELAAWYRANVATDDGFVIVADGFADVARAMRRKVLFEIAYLHEETTP